MPEEFKEVPGARKHAVVTQKELNDIIEVVGLNMEQRMVFSRMRKQEEKGMGRLFDREDARGLANHIKKRGIKLTDGSLKQSGTASKGDKKNVIKKSFRGK
jgi:hypothetical protein